MFSKIHLRSWGNINENRPDLSGTLDFLFSGYSHCHVSGSLKI